MRTHTADTSGDGSDDYLDRIVGRLSDRDQEVHRRLEKVKAVYVPCGRDTLLTREMANFLTTILARRGERRDDGRLFFVTGESGAGKTLAVERLLRECPALQPIATSYGLVRPVISVSLSGPCTLKMLGKRILGAAGYPLRSRIEQGELWEMLPEQMHARRILVVHVDETQHLLRHTEKDRERKDLAKALKDVMNSPWPVSFIMSGMPNTTEIARLDEQIERRSRFVELPDVELPEGRELVERIVSEMAAAADLDSSEVCGSDMLDRIAHAARYRYGRIAQVVLSAIQVACLQRAGALARKHFAEAYRQHSHARGFDEMNPFLVADFHRLAPGSFLVEHGDVT